MKIRNAEAKDLSEIMGLISSCVEDMERRGIHQWDEIYPDEKTIRNDIDKKQLYLLEEDNQICGIIVLNELQEPQYKSVGWKFGGKTLVVHRLAIRPAYQRKGMATKLMEFAYSYAIKRDYKTIRLDAFIQNPASVGLYEKLGYRKAGEVTFRKGDFYCFEMSVDSLKI
jgi:ribosomal protein S18 acetylase RimI-like enzyme